MKYYKVIKPNFLWEVGAILKKEAERYSPIEELYNNPHEETEYISAAIVENTPEYFQRVYPVNLLTKIVYKVRKEAKQMLDELYK